MMKTLIIHPKDSSTSFLDIIYKNIPEKTVITGGVSKSDIKRLINEHDRIMMMGHGSPHGLFSVGQFTNCYNYIIDYTMVEHLKDKTDNIYIWCHADQFVNEYELRGFYSGMFISEVSEAKYCGLIRISQDIVDESNYKFCNFVSKYINEDKSVLYDNVKKEYGLLAEENSVAFYNNKRLFVS